MRAASARASTTRCSPSCMRMLEPIVRDDAAVCAAARRDAVDSGDEDDDVGRAALRLRGALSRMDAGWRAAPRDVLAACVRTRVRAIASVRASAATSSSPSATPRSAVDEGPRVAERGDRPLRPRPVAPPQDDGRRRRDQLLEPQEDLLAGGRIHEGRSDRLLPRDLAVDVALSQQSAARDDALSRRHRRQVVLPEGRAGVRAELDSHAADLERGHPARHQLLRLRRPRVAALRREPRLDSRCTSGTAASGRSSCPIGA